MKKVEEIMTSDVITVSPGTTIHRAAELLANHGISGLRVVDDQGAVVGILSEGDLIVRQRPRPRPSFWRLFFEDGERLAREYQKATGTTVAEVMTTTLIIIRPDAPLEAAAALLDQHKIRRLPVMEEGRLVGIVSRGDLVKTLAAATPAAPSAVSDAQLVKEMKTRMDREAWISSVTLTVEAKDGVLALWGPVESETERSALETMARAIPGCRSVDNKTIVLPRLISRYGGA
jgi:CBS-domain-containing membrane protein